MPVTDKESAVDIYTSAGLTLFSCGGGPERKAPINQGNWQHTPYNSELSPEDLNDYFAVVLPDDVMVLDYDSRRDESEHHGDTNQLMRLAQTLNIGYFNTFIVQTGGGGYHIYLKKPSEVQLYATVPGYPAIDIKTGGGYVLAAGSLHYTGSTYQIYRGDPSEIAECPAQLLELCTRAESPYRELSAVETDDQATCERFISFCQRCEPAVEGDGGDHRTFVVAATGKDFGLSQTAVCNIMSQYFNPRCVPPWSEEDLLIKVRNAFEYSENPQGARSPQATMAALSEELNTGESYEQFASAHNDRIVWSTTVDRNTGQRRFDPTVNNVVGFFSLMPHGTYENPLYKLLRYNRFAQRIEFTRPAPWHDPDYPSASLTDTDVLQVKKYLTTKALFASTETVREGCVLVAQENAYHPVRDWLQNLPAWDRTPRIDNWLFTYCGTPHSEIIDDLTKEIAKNTLIAAVARIMKPGCQHDSMIVLEGKQGTGKTSVVRVLGGEWYGDVKIDPSNKDTVVRLRGKWITEMSEMAALKYGELSALKRFITLTTDSERLPYERLAVDLPREFIFMGTINPGAAGYLSDTTGNRRFWVVKTGVINLPALARDREQLFAEALYRFRQGEPWHITDPRIEALARMEQDSRVMRDQWTDTIEQFLHHHANDFENLTTEIVAWHALNLSVSRIGRMESVRIAEAMRAAGYEQKRIRHEGKRIYVWAREDDADPTIDLI